MRKLFLDGEMWRDGCYVSWIPVSDGSSLGSIPDLVPEAKFLVNLCTCI
jgi:hypothetical protein